MPQRPVQIQHDLLKAHREKHLRIEGEKHEKDYLAGTGPPSSISGTSIEPCECLVQLNAA